MSLISEKRAPALRFKDDQGRDYPDWEHNRLGELYDITSSKRVFQSEWKDSGVPFYRAREIIELSNNGFVDNDLFICPEMYKRYSEKYGAPKQNDLLITGVGTIGKLYIVPKNSNFYIKDGNIIWLKDKKLVSGVFVKYLFLTRYIEKQLFDNASITTVATYTIEAAKKTKVLLPVVEEQQIIAAFLSAVDTKIEQLNRKKSLLEQYKRGMMQKLFSQEVRFKDDAGNDYPSWEKVKFSSLYSFQPTNSFSRDKLNYKDGRVRNIHYGDIHTKYRSGFELDKENVPFLEAGIDLGKVSEASYCKVGDLVIADASEDYSAIGKTIELLNLNGEQVLAGLHTILARLNTDRVHVGYGAYVMACYTVKLQVMRMAHGTKVLGISAGRMGKIELPLPSREEQQKIANFLSVMDRKIELVAAQIEQARSFKKGLLQQMFI